MRNFGLLGSIVGICASLLLGCGSKSGLRDWAIWGSRSDGGMTDGSRPDGRVDGGSEFVIECGRRDRYTSPRRPIAISATVMSTGAVTSTTWSLTTTPSGSMPMFTSGASAAGLTPDMEGDYGLRFDASDNAGHSGSCEVVVHSIVGPPVAICPEDEIVTNPNMPVLVSGDGYDDNGIVEWAWRIVSAPSGSVPSLSPTDAPETTFMSNLAGNYLLELRVADADAASSTCEARVRVNTPPFVTCPAPISAPTRRPVSITASATDDTLVVGTTWELVSRPGDSMADIDPRDGLTTTMTPDRAGPYSLRFTAIDEDGASSSCDVIVNATPTPPDAICPDTISTTPLSTVELVGDGVDDGSIVAYAWSLVSQPPASSASPPSPGGSQRARFTVDVAGEYLTRLSVTDNDGEVGTCTTLVRAISTEGLRVEMFWNAPDRSCERLGGAPGCDGTDVDLHMINSTASAWFGGDDCHYSNCQRGNVVPWGAPGIEDDPHLDLDDTDGFGPENTNIDRPRPETYRVGVHFFSSDESGNDADVVVNVYCGAGATTPIATFGPVRLANSGDDFWRVADITVGAGTCSVADLAIAGSPNVISQSEARTVR